MFGKRLTSLRKSKNLTQQQVADSLKMSRGTYGHYEIGRREPDFETLQQLAVFFGVTTDFLLGKDTEPGQIEVVIKEDAGIYNISDIDNILKDTRQALAMAVRDGHITEEKAVEAVDLARRQLMLFLESKK